LGLKYAWDLCDIPHSHWAADVGWLSRSVYAAFQACGRDCEKKIGATAFRDFGLSVHLCGHEDFHSKDAVHTRLMAHAAALQLPVATRTHQ
jgi:hypothetical protein